MTALWRLVSVIEHPATKFASHAVLALGGLLEMVDTPFEAMLGVDLGAHHGVFAFAFLNMLRQAAAFLAETSESHRALRERRVPEGPPASPPGD